MAAGEDEVNAMIQITVYINDMGTTRAVAFFVFPNQEQWVVSDHGCLGPGLSVLSPASYSIG